MRELDPKQFENSFTMIVQYEGRDIPLTVICSPEDETDMLIEAVADLLVAQLRAEGPDLNFFQPQS